MPSKLEHLCLNQQQGVSENRRWSPHKKEALGLLFGVPRFSETPPAFKWTVPESDEQMQKRHGRSHVVLQFGNSSAELPPPYHSGSCALGGVPGAPEGVELLDFL